MTLLLPNRCRQHGAAACPPDAGCSPVGGEDSIRVGKAHGWRTDRVLVALPSLDNLKEDAHSSFRQSTERGGNACPTIAETCCRAPWSC